MTLPQENLDDKTYEELVKEAVSRIPIYAPEWTDYNIHDPGITFIELFAWLIEMQIYRLDQVTEKNKRKFLKLLGIRPKPATAAKVDVTFSLPQVYTESVSVPKGTKITAKDVETDENIVFETDRIIHVVPVKLECVFSQFEEESRDNTDANEEPDGHFYHAFGKKAEEGSMLYLGFDEAEEFPREEIELMVYLYEAYLELGVKPEEEDLKIIPQAELKWEYSKSKDAVDWTPLELDKDETASFMCSGRISFRVPADEDKKYWIRCRVEKAGYEIPPRIDAILLNTVPASQGDTVEDEILGSSTGLPNQTFSLQHKPILAHSQVITILNKRWARVDDFDSSGQEDTHYVIDCDTGEIIFGDDVHGLIPPKGDDNIKAKEYRFGGGEKGNVKAGAINLILDVDEKVKTLKVTNKLPASGGKEKETLEEAIIRARKDLKTVYRAVTSADYEHLAKNVPGLRVARAKAIPRYHPGQDSEVPGIVTVIVVPDSTSANDKPKPGTGFRKTVYRHLDEHRLLTTELFVMSPEYVEVSVDATVAIKPKSEPSRVKEDVEEELRNFLDPITGGVDRKGWPFGRPVYKSEIYELIDGVDGVDYVTSVLLKRKGKDQPGDILISPHSLVSHSVDFSTIIEIEKGASHE